MVKEKEWKNGLVYFCEVCGLGYSDRETAQACEEWCKKTGTCSVDITKKAVYFPDPFQKRSTRSR